MESILTLEDHGSRFPRQSKDKMFVSKMFVDLPCSGVELVEKMQVGEHGEFLDYV